MAPTTQVDFFLGMILFRLKSAVVDGDLLLKLIWKLRLLKRKTLCVKRNACYQTVFFTFHVSRFTLCENLCARNSSLAQDLSEQIECFDDAMIL